MIGGGAEVRPTPERFDGIDNRIAPSDRSNGRRRQAPVPLERARVQRPARRRIGRAISRKRCQTKR